MRSTNRTHALVALLMSLTLLVSFFAGAPVNRSLAAPPAQAERETHADPPRTTATSTVYLPLIVGGSQTGGELPPFTYSIDPASTPDPASLPGLTDDRPRPLATITDPDGRAATFVANEIIVQTDDTDALNEIVRRYDGEILLEIDAAAQGISGLPRTYLIRVNVATADLARLEEDLNALDGGAEGRATGAHRISSEDGARLLAIAGAEARDGHTIGVNWVGESDVLPTSSEEAPGGPTLGGIAYTPDVYDWVYMAQGTTQDIGVPEAWSLLHRAGRLGNRVQIAILDKGFAPHSDFPGSMTLISVIPGISDPRGVRGDSRSPWHGTSVYETAMARHDNAFGVAGTAAPVGDPILVYTGYDYITSIAAVIAARAAGADIMNMSYSARVPAIVSWTALPFEATTAAVRASGALLFASAGNDGSNVDGEDCFLGICWEHTLITPCENAGVICVGGLGWNSQNRDSGSNYGHEAVKIFAPYTVYAGPNPDNPGAGTNARAVSGTSFASPYTAGVAALIWAANPRLSADQVWATMRDTAHSSPDPRVPRYVNAYAGVLRTVGSAASVELTGPSDGATFELNNRIEFSAGIGYVAERDGIPLIVEWREGSRVLRTETFTPGAGSHSLTNYLYLSDLSAGSHTISVRVTAGSVTDEDQTTINVRNSPPTAEIVQPATGAAICAGEAITLRGEATDINQLAGLPDSAFRWSSNRDGVLGTGPTLVRDDLSAGSHTITLRVTDSGGLTAEDTTTVVVKSATDPDCTDLSPAATITSPANNASFLAEAEDTEGWYASVTLVGDVSDPEDASGALSVEWHSNIDGDLGTVTPDAAGRVELTTRLHIRPEDVGTGGSQHTLTLRVEDSDGNVTEDTITVWITILI